VRIALALIAVVLAAGCATPQEPAEQAEEVHSIAAEGALLAHEVAEGDTRAAFAQEHTKALRKLLAELRRAIDDPHLAELADDVDRSLAELARSPGNPQRAVGAERKLGSAAKAAEELSR
jgi:hypothetical protein